MAKKDKEGLDIQETVQPKQPEKAQAPAENMVQVLGLRMLRPWHGNVQYPIDRGVKTTIPSQLFNKLSKLNPPGAELV